MSLGHIRAGVQTNKEGAGRAEDRRAVQAAQRLIPARKKPYMYHENIFLIYCLKCSPNKAWKGGESNPITVLVLSESRNGLEMSEQALLTLSHLLAVPTSF